MLEALSLACDPCSGHIDICWWCGDGPHTWMGPLNGRALALGCYDVWCSLLEPWLLMMVPCWMMMALEALALDWWSPWWCSPWWWWSPCWRLPWRWSHLFFLPGWWLLDDGFGAMMFVELCSMLSDGCCLDEPLMMVDGWALVDCMIAPWWFILPSDGCGWMIEPLMIGWACFRWGSPYLLAPSSLYLIYSCAILYFLAKPFLIPNATLLAPSKP